MHSAFWSVTQQILRQGLVAVFTFILARKVSPAEFGLVGVAAIWNTFLHLFLELGLGAALVQRKEINARHASVVLLLNLSAGLLLMILSLLLSGPVAFVLKDPAAQPVIATLSICFFITSAASTQIALAQRDLRFKDLALRDFAANLTAIGAGIAFAFQNYGVWSVVISSLLLNTLNALFVWRLVPVRFQIPSAAEFRDLFPYSAKVFLYTGLKYFLRSLDSIAVGFLFGAERLGLYNFANRITAAPTKALQLGLGSFLFPRAALAQDDPAKLRDLFALAFKTLAYPMALFTIGLLTVGNDLILLLFGAQWIPAIPVIRLLLLAQFAALIFVPFAELLKATGQAGALLTWGLLMALITATSLAVGSQHGFETSLRAFIAATLLLATAAALVLIRLFPGLISQTCARLRPFLLIFAAAAGLALLMTSAFDNQLFPRAIAISSVGLASLASAYAFDPDIRRICRLILRSEQGKTSQDSR